MQAAAKRNWRLEEATEATPIIEAPQPSIGEYHVPGWTKVAIAVTSATTLIGWGATGQVFAGQFNTNPAIALAADMAAGLLARASLKIILNPVLDRKIYHYTTRYDHVIFQSLSILQQALQTLWQPANMRQVWFPMIFFHSGFVLSGYVIFKVSETKGNEPEYQGFIEERPLLEGDTWGSPDGLMASMKPFLFKSLVLAVSGAGMAAIGYSVQSFTVWRLGLVMGGMGLAMTPTQQGIMQLNRHRESFMRNLTSCLGPKARKLLALTVNLMPVFANVAVCSTMAVTINAKKAAMHMDVVAAVINLTAGAALGVLDVTAQDRFQHPTTVSDRHLSEKPILTRCCEDVRRRPGNYVAIGASLLLEAGLVVANILDPSPDSTMDAIVILTTTVGTLALSYLAEALCPPGANRSLNQINFRLTRSLHIVNAVYLVFMTHYYLGILSEGEVTAMWAVYGILMGLFLKPNLDENSNDWAGPSTTYLAESGVTMDGYVTKTL